MGDLVILELATMVFFVLGELLVSRKVEGYLKPLQKVAV